MKNYRDKHNDSLITDLDDVSIVCENEDINAEKDVKVKLALLTIVFTHFCWILLYDFYTVLCHFNPWYTCTNISTVSPPSYGCSERGEHCRTRTSSNLPRKRKVFDFSLDSPIKYLLKISTLFRSSLNHNGWIYISF